MSAYTDVGNSWHQRGRLLVPRRMRVIAWAAVTLSILLCLIVASVSLSNPRTGTMDLGANTKSRETRGQDSTTYEITETGTMLPRREFLSLSNRKATQTTTTRNSMSLSQPPART